MIIEIDEGTGETVMRLDTNELGDILFALDVTATEAKTEKNRLEALEMRKMMVDLLGSENIRVFNSKLPVAES